MVRSRLLLSLVLFALLCASTAGTDGTKEGSDTITGSAPRPNRAEIPFGILILPGFASTQLQAWRPNTCGVGSASPNDQQDHRSQDGQHGHEKKKQPSSPFFQIPMGARLWVNVAQMIQTPQCWYDCMILTLNQTDHPGGCVARPAPGISAVDQLDPGVITGPLSAVWTEFLHKVTEEFAYDQTTLVAAGYDWRLAPSLLDDRDDYFHALKLQIEQLYRVSDRRRRGPRQPPRLDESTIANERRPRGIAILAHSLGNNLLRYFVAWLERELGGKQAHAWFDKHVEYYVGLGAPFMGAAQSLQAILEGSTFGLPLSAASARGLLTTFSSGPWMLPDVPVPDESDEAGGEEEEEEEEPRWPFDTVVSISGTDSGFRKIENFGAADVLPFLEQLAKHDPVVGHRAFELYRKYYVDDPLVELGRAWKRPPIRHIFMAYGYNTATEIHYHFQKPQKAYQELAPNTPWTRLSTILEQKENIVLRQRTTGVEKMLSTVPGRRSGDGVVPYASLSPVHKWLFKGNVTETRRSQHFYDRQTVLGLPPHDKTITFYESRDETNSRTTSVWEIEEALHREIVADPIVIREFVQVLRHLSHSDIESAFPSKEERPPASDADCYWDYLGVKCALPEFCEYRYRLGDITLDMSCRLHLAPTPGPENALTDDSCFWDYSKMQCAYLDYCAYSYQFGDLTLDQSCRLMQSKESVQQALEDNHDLFI